MKLSRRKVIVSCAVNGPAHTPSMSDSLPYSKEQIIRHAVEAARAGASILHLHACDPADGSPTEDTAVLDDLLPAIAAQTDAIISAMPAAPERKPELISLGMGSSNHAFGKAVRGISKWKFAWEKPYLEASEDGVHRNSFRDIKTMMARLADADETRCQFDCRDLGHLYSLAQLIDEGLVMGPLFLQCSLGMAGGLNSDPENLFLFRSTADRLFGRENYEFSVLAAGRQQIPLVTMGAVMGGHVRVGLGDSLYLGKGLLATSSAAQVLKIRRILEELSFEIASPEEARAILQIRSARVSGVANREVGLNG
ncbi:3-keto-5-aminohexanoate cleavage protein [Hoeflea sp.]|uniref:3-keto-5-aminohexanoate cleavage protein n=1 Tax=Hoeflea sp. TaxID=1940281 RepID=UPI003BAEA68B